MLPVIQANVIASDNGPLAPEQWSKLVCDKIVHVSETAPQELREQVGQFRNEIEKLLAIYFKQAMDSAEKHTIKRFE